MSHYIYNMVAPRNRQGHYMWKYKFKPKKISPWKSFKRTIRLAQMGYGNKNIRHMKQRKVKSKRKLKNVRTKKKKSL